MVQAKGFHENKTQVDSVFLFLKKGTTQVRILPAYNDSGVWCKEIKEIPWHDENGKFKPIVSPATNGDPCPFLEEGKRLYELGGEENVELAKQFRPSSKFLFNVVVQEAPDGNPPVSDCVKVLKCGISVKREIFDLDQDKAGGWGDITNIEQGIDIRITREGEGQFGTSYTVKGVPTGRNSILEWLESKGFTGELEPHNLDEFYTPKSYEELLPLFEMKKASMSASPDADLPEPTELEAPVPQVVSENTEAPSLPETN